MPASTHPSVGERSPSPNDKTVILGTVEDLLALVERAVRRALEEHEHRVAEAADPEEGER